MRIGFTTCVEVGRECLEAIAASDGELAAVITLEDDIAPKKSGRVWLDAMCAESEWPLYKIRHIGDTRSAELIESLDLDWLFIIGWSQIAPPEILRIPRYGCVGMHPTLLPAGRGNAAIPWAILKGLDQTGVSMFKLDAGVDTGPVVAQLPVAMEAGETATMLYDKISLAHRSLMSNHYDSFLNGDVPAVAQDESLATVWPRRRPDDGEILDQLSVIEALRLVRASTKPYPGAFIRTDSGRLIVWAASENRTTERDVRIDVSDGFLWAVDFVRVDE